MTRRSVSKRVAVVTATAVVAVGTFAAGVGVAGTGGDDKAASKKQIAGLFDQWNRTLQTGDPKKVADLYASDAVLLPTVSNKVRSDRATIVDYFEHFLANKPVGKKIETHVNVLDGNSAIDAGVYQFTLTDRATGEKSVVKARYTYAYEKRNGEWKIVNHHSSKLPEG
ncbi:SgcJ/EcaC family oxidoreductase [Streptomyces sp. ISL-22]|uniref:SgcJ/EcaC family oxidoreductase n=1 Tax=unclassified Streptomyces TaxID=2593676 RepID=UPI001BE598D2|nr:MULTISPECIES: SgcJ/EcaC family oxidoreductase [unclassified Streptomyces]MBT2416987.1 SgcJ/EcaC family oxidoreductase [Streptomyces sp. ISL-24]MBT2430639.1 SgcJ/EcaC family oxidoreductase [Streptomyces sp. ISL-22]